MPITVNYFGSVKPGTPGAKPIRVGTLDEKTPFGKRNPISWQDGKHMVRLGGEEATTDEKVKSDANDPTAGRLSDKVGKSIVVNEPAHKIELSGDAETPGASKVYGTNGSGVKGWLPVPSSAAENPGAWVSSIGSAAGADGPINDSWTSGGALGLQLMLVARVVYNPYGAKIIYKMMRTLTFDKYGRLYSVSPEVAAIVDTPVMDL